MTVAVISCGTNLGDRLAHLAIARAVVADSLVRCSGIYATAAWGVTDQPDFYNQTLLVSNKNISPDGWLELAHQAEEKAQRIRNIRWGPRTLDVDIIAVWDGETEILSDDSRLTLPHPLAHQRAFVLKPWLEINDAAMITVDGHQQAVAQLLSVLPSLEVDGVTRVSERALSEVSRPPEFGKRND